MSLLLHVEPLWISPYVFAVYVTLREKKLEFESVPLHYDKGGTNAAAYLATTITGRVPTLVHDGFALGESTAIIEYLEETFPETRVLPASTTERARCRQLMSWLRSDDTAPLREERSTHTMFFERSTTPLSAAGERSAKKLVEVAGRVVRPGMPNLFDAWSIVDAELAYALHRLIANGDPVPSGLQSWAEAQFQRPTVRAFLDLARPKHPPLTRSSSSPPAPPSVR